MAVGLTQEGLAWECGHAKSYLCEIESGRKLPSLDVLFDIAERLNVELYDLLLDPDTSDRARAGEALRLASPEAQSQVYALLDPWMPPRSTTVGT